MKIMQISIKRKATTALSLVIFALGSLALSPMARAVGVEAPDTALAGGNTADGQLALGGLTTGFYNSAFGIYALLSNGAANFNTGVGAGALLSNTADQSTAVGAGALLSNTTGTVNTATGAFALFSNTTGGSNTATGAEALLHNTLGGGNTATGQQALQANTTGALNTSTGAATLITNTTGSANTADGLNALFSNNGDNNTAVGNGALGANTTGSNNVALGLGAGSGVTTANNVICIGTNVAGNDVNDSCYIGNIFGDTSSGGTAVFVNTNGRLGTTTSSRRFKDSIKPMDQASEALFALKPVTFRYKKEIDPQGIPQFGLVAEDVAAVNPDLVVRDKEGKPHSVRYEQVNAMLLNEFLKQHRTVQELRNEIAALTSTVKQQAAQIQNVSDQIEINKAEPGMVRNDLREAESSTSSQ
jgi:Chaperone of endosialidase